MGRFKEKYHAHDWCVWLRFLDVSVEVLSKNIHSVEVLIHDIKIIIFFNQEKNRIKATPNEKNLTQDLSDNF